MKKKYPYIIVVVLSLLLTPFLSFGDFGAIIIIALIDVFWKGENSKIISRKDVIFLCLLYIICLIQSFLFFLIGNMDFAYFSRGCSTTLNYIVWGFFCYRFIEHYNEDALLYMTDSLVLAYSFSVVAAIIQFGFLEVAIQTMSIFIGGFESAGSETDTILEACHQILLVMPLVSVLFYYRYKTSHDKRYLTRLILAIIISLLAYKRIAIASALLIFIVSYIFIKLRSSLLLPCSIGGVVFCIVFIYLTKNGEIYDYADKFGIDLAFRDVLWKGITNQYEFSVDFIGRGWGYITKYVHLYNMQIWNIKIGGLHSDILRTYIELGFCGFILFKSYLLYFYPKILQKSSKYASALVFLLCQLYALLVETTDNIMSYPACQLILILAPFCILEIGKIKNRQ